MKTEINIDNWKRKDHYRFFTSFEEPFFGVTVQIDCTRAYASAKRQHTPFFLFYLYQALLAANRVEEFRYRIADDRVFLFDSVHASATINRPDGTFGFAYMDFNADEDHFYRDAQQAIREVRESSGLKPAVSGENVIHFSAVPWLNFSSLSHARSFTFPDSCPKISFGKVTEVEGRKSMPVSIHGHHGLMDGFHAGLFVEEFQKLMDQ